MVELSSLPFLIGEADDGKGIFIIFIFAVCPLGGVRSRRRDILGLS